MKNKHELEDLLLSVIPIAVYRGVTVTKTKKGYSVFNIEVKDAEGVDEVIDAHLKSLEKSIIRSKEKD